MNKLRGASLLGVSAAVVAAVAVPFTAHAGETSAVSTPDSSPQIVGGEKAKEGAYPWMTRLEIKYKTSTMACGGSMLSSDIVLTAQQCLAEDPKLGKPTAVTVDIGKVDYTDADDEGQRRSGAHYYLGKGIKKGDWAVIKLDKPFAAKAFAKLPKDDELDSQETLRAIGYGSTSEGGKPSQYLHQVDLPVVAPAKCGDNTDVEICAGDVKKGGLDTCAGDSGGPLLADPKARKTDWVIVGITSHGIGCGRKGEPGHYTKVSAFTKQIQAAITLLEGHDASTNS